MDLKKVTAEYIRHADITDIVETVIVRNPDLFREGYDRIDQSSVEDNIHAFVSLYGWEPALAVREWLAIESVLTDNSCRCWTDGDRSLSLDLPLTLPEEERRQEYLAAYAAGVFAGFFQISEDASGDRVYASLLPDKREIFIYDYSHETGTIRIKHTLKSFLFDIGLSENDPEPDESPGWVGSDEYDRIQKELVDYDNSLNINTDTTADIYDRSYWIIEVLFGKPSLKSLICSPTLLDWQKEKDIGFDQKPFLLNYWLVAHTLLGNNDDAVEAVRIAEKSKSGITRWLGNLVSGILKGEETRIGKNPDDISSIRKQLRDMAPS
jgi:hypothetical protein